MSTQHHILASGLMHIPPLVGQLSTIQDVVPKLTGPSDNNFKRDTVGKEAKHISRVGDISCKDESLPPPQGIGMGVVVRDLL